LDPLLRWLAVDGFGFHEGYFHSRQSIVNQRVPAGVGSYGRRAFDQGLGRSLWFSTGADAGRLSRIIETFTMRRRGDLWSGVGLACAYAGGLDETGVDRLTAATGPFLPDFAQGVAFAAKARQRAGNPVRDTEHVCRIACCVSAAEAAGVTDVALHNLPPDGDEPAYEVWRRRIRAELVSRNFPPAPGPWK